MSVSDETVEHGDKAVTFGARRLSPIHWADQEDHGRRMKNSRGSVLEGLVRRAIQLGADAVEVEYRDGFGEAVAYLGPLGRLLARFQSGSPDEVALRRDLYAWKGRPLRIAVEGESRIVRTQVWDSFGEDAFRISLWAAQQAVAPVGPAAGKSQHHRKAGRVRRARR